MAIYASRTARADLGPVAASDSKIPVEDLSAAGRLAAGWPSRAASAAEDIGSRAATPGEIYALSRIEEALQRLVERYLEETDSTALERARENAVERIGGKENDRLLKLFGSDFALVGDSGTALRELPVWMTIDENPAARHATSFLFAGPFRSDEALTPLLAALESGFASEAPTGLGSESLLDLLRAPARAEPESLAGQLRYILGRWADLLQLDRDAFLRGLDLLAEEAKAAVFGDGGGPVEAPSFTGLDGEAERYSADRDWMPSVVLMAKNVYVWLHQLSVSFDRSIDRVDQVPDEALDEMARRGFTGLWLIGVWERSDASRRLKQMAGNPEAVASAYSVRGYGISEDLGGEAAIDDLRRRCGERGIRLAADMVPNHMGIDSDWVLDEPQRFLSVPSSPFAGYSFDGADFSPRSEIAIQVEDHYFDRSDAAVVFRRLDHRTGEQRFIYHGNDGTNMPWNDTAQLDYLNPETREAVIQTILEVARRFPIIRFDAAMTLARRHFQRLWFPAPGTGGAIPSRAEHGLSRERFAELMPAEFWREVVDRVAAEAPDTLLLAEAFWLMEGYFVRTLGMHRVYNSAFMHMVRDQENSKYKRLLKDTLVFDPRILNRYVNFLTNPDERTAVDQFGRDDRYFGACVLLATLPGLPMFGHGQIEGHAEKYGMEYRRSYSDEPVDEELVARHDREIVPLLRRRRQFAGVQNFELYDFVEDSGVVNDDVFAYSNGEGDERNLVVFNNSFSTLSGRVWKSAGHATRGGTDLAGALGLGGGEQRFWVFEDRISGSTYLRPAGSSAGSGLHLRIPGFGYRVFAGFRLVDDDTEQRYSRLEGRLDGNGVGDLGRALADLDLEPAAAALRELFRSPVFVRGSSSPRPLKGERGSDDRSLAAAVQNVVEKLPEWARHGDGDVGDGDVGDIRELETELSGITELFREERRKRGEHRKTPRAGDPDRTFEEWIAWSSPASEVRSALLGIQILAALATRSPLGVELLDRLSARTALGEALEELGAGAERSWRAAEIASVAISDAWIDSGRAPEAAREPHDARSWIRGWTENHRCRELIGVHHANDCEWVRKEDLTDLACWRLAFGLAGALRHPVEEETCERKIGDWLRAVTKLEKLAADAGYRVDRMREPESESQGAAAADAASPSEHAKTAKE